jgi:hypothetical protein
MAIRDPFQRQREQEQKQGLFTPDHVDGQAAHERLDTGPDKIVPPDIEIEDKTPESDEDDLDETPIR